MVNLSNKLFTRYEFKLLNKGLSFCPTPKQYNRINFNKDLQTFLRRIKLRAHFGIDNHEHEPTEEEIFGFKQKSNWTPRFNNHTVDTFIAAVTNDISNSQIKKCPKDNLTKEERKALQRLKERQDIVITKADKGGATVIWDVEDYIRESERQLNNENFYRKLDHNPIQEHVNLINNTLEDFKDNNELSPEIVEGLKPSEPKTPRLYMLPKIHKEGNP